MLRRNLLSIARSLLTRRSLRFWLLLLWFAMMVQKENFLLVCFGKNPKQMNKSCLLMQQLNCKEQELVLALILPYTTLLQTDHMSGKHKREIFWISFIIKIKKLGINHQILQNLKNRNKLFSSVDSFSFFKNLRKKNKLS